MQVFTRGKVPVNDFTSERCAFQNLHQNQTGKTIGLFCVIGILFKDHIADHCYEFSQGGVDPVATTVYFHVASFRLEKTGTIRSSF
jgi:hypothetical protein